MGPRRPGGDVRDRGWHPVTRARAGPSRTPRLVDVGGDVACDELRPPPPARFRVGRRGRLHRGPPDLRPGTIGASRPRARRSCGPTGGPGGRRTSWLRRTGGRGGRAVAGRDRARCGIGGRQARLAGPPPGRRPRTAVVAPDSERSRRLAAHRRGGDRRHHGLAVGPLRRRGWAGRGLAGPAGARLPPVVAADQVVDGPAGGGRRRPLPAAGTPVVIGAGRPACEVLGTGSAASTGPWSAGAPRPTSRSRCRPTGPPPAGMVVSRAADGGWLLEGGLSAAGSLLAWLARLHRSRPRTGHAAEGLPAAAHAGWWPLPGWTAPGRPGGDRRPPPPSSGWGRSTDLEESGSCRIRIGGMGGDPVPGPWRPAGPAAGIRRHRVGRAGAAYRCGSTC